MIGGRVRGIGRDPVRDNARLCDARGSWAGFPAITGLSQTR